MEKHGRYRFISGAGFRVLELRRMIRASFGAAGMIFACVGWVSIGGDHDTERLEIQLHL